MKTIEITEGLWDRIRSGIDNKIGQSSLVSLGYIIGVANTVGLERIQQSIGRENMNIFLQAVNMARQSNLLHADKIIKAVEEGIRDAQSNDSTLDGIVRAKFDKVRAGINYIQSGLQENLQTSPVITKKKIKEQILTERASGILYHVTTSEAAKNILETGQFHLVSSLGTSVEYKMGVKNKPYYLSTSRTRIGDYGLRRGTEGVTTFVLDGDWFNLKGYTVKPVDYWEQMWMAAPDRFRESEDRIYSDRNSIPIDSVREIHILCVPITQDDRKRRDTRAFRIRKNIREVLLMAKSRGISAYLYDKIVAYRTLNKKLAVDITSSRAKEILNPGYTAEPQYRSKYMYIRTPYLKKWIELIHKNKKEDLSQEADRLRYLLTTWGALDGDHHLSNDLHNTKKPDDPDYRYNVAITDYLNKHHLTPLELAKKMELKWREIGDKS